MKQQNVVQEKVEKLVQWKDMLKVQAHLFNAEVQDQWNRLEKDWHLLETEFGHLAPDAKRAAKTIGKAAIPLLHKIETSLDKIQTEISHNHSQEPEDRSRKSQAV